MIGYAVPEAASCVAERWQLAWPEPFSKPVVHRTVNPFLICTVPVGLVGLCGVTVTLNATVASLPYATVEVDNDSAVVVADGFTAMDKDPDVEVNPRESVTVNVSGEPVPKAVGVPVIVPVEVFNDSPDGKVPVTAQCVYVPLPPVAAKVAE